MTATWRQEFQHPPSTWRFMTEAFRPRPGLVRAGAVPAIALTWRNWHCRPQDLARIAELTGLDAQAPVCILVPHILTFRLCMALLTHPAFPIPMWSALQIRNQLLQHRPLQVGSAHDVHSAVASQRVLEKGAEVDIHTQLTQDGRTVWESINTFYYRGRFGAAQAPSAAARAPTVQGTQVQCWHAPGGSGWRFGGLTGDYNGIHWSRHYARVFGFKRDFHHPQRVLGQCLAHLAHTLDEPAQRLDTWLKGPVFYDTDLRLLVQPSGDGLCFALSQDHDTREAIVAQWRPATARERLLERSERT